MSDHDRNLTEDENQETSSPETVSGSQPEEGQYQAVAVVGGISPGRTAWYVFLTLLVVGFGCGCAVFYALGGEWTGVMQLDQKVLMILGAAVGGTLLIGWLSAWAVGRAAASAQRRYRQAENVLEGVASLDFENAKRWQDPRLKAHPGLSDFTSLVWKTYLRLKEKEQKNLGLVGEVLRLESGLLNGQRDELDETYEHPDICRLAYEILQLFDGKAKIQEELERLRGIVDQSAEELMPLTQESLAWNVATLDRLNIQMASLAKQVHSTETLAVSVQQACNQAGGDEGHGGILDGATKALADTSVMDLKEALHGTADSISELADQQGNLAFQIAMQVATLGKQGESLLPLVQELESMTTEFKSVSSRLEDLDRLPGSAAKALAEANRCLEGLRQILGTDQEATETWREVADQVNELLPALSQVVSAMNAYTPEFNEQTGRLNDLGVKWSKLTGTEFEPVKVDSSPSEAPSVVGLQIERSQPSLSKAKDRVYDLSEFGAVAVKGGVSGSEDPEDRIYDLSEFGAVAV